MSSVLDSDYVHSYYAATAPLGEALAPLAGGASADVCVVGAGIAGCSAALALAERGYRVVLLEAQRLGWGASGRAGGQVIFGLSVEQDELESLVGRSDAHAIWELALAGIAALKARMARHRIDCEWVDGQMLTAIKPRQWQRLQHFQAWIAARYGYTSPRLIERAQLRSLVSTERYIGALYDSNGGHLNPLRYTLGLALAAQQAGAALHEASPVLGYSHASGKLRVRTASGEVQCAQLVLAG